MHTGMSEHSRTAAADLRLEDQIAELVEVIRINRSQIERYEAVIDNAKAELAALLAQRGENWADAEGYARLVSAGLRHLYDARALDEMIIQDPLRYGWLKDFRRESHIPERIQVK